MIMTIALGIAMVIFLYYVAAAIELMRGNRSLPWLRDAPREEPTALPFVSVIIAARQEADTIEPALCSVLAQDYSQYEVIVVDDRSEDTTGAILDRIAQRDSRLSVLHIKELPAGWLGKNHALYQGTLRARGQWYLFSDADIVMDPSTLRRAVSWAQALRADHLVAIPRIVTRHVGLEGFVSSFVVGFGLWYRIWRARTQDRRYYVGIGAFNFVRAQTYQNAGTHRAIALRPDDDMKLGKIIKQSGAHQELLLAPDLIHVEWYPSLRALIAGLMKNSFAGIDYSWIKLAVTLIVIGGLHVWPWIALAATRGATQGLYALTVLMILAMAGDNARFHWFRRWIGLLDPFAALLIIYILVRAAILTTWQQGIRWRGTLYPLAALKANNV